IDWDSPDWTRSNLDNAVYIYNSNTGSYASYVGGVGTNGGSRYIASQQAFWVKANAASPSISSIEDVKASTNPSHMKMMLTPNTSLYPMAFKDFPVPQNTNNNPNSFLLTLSGGGYDDETFLQFTSGATNDFDDALDAWKLFGSLNITSVHGDTLDYSINRLPALTSNASVKLRVTVPATGTYSIRRDSLLMLPMSSCIFLEDLVTGTLTDLRQNISYSFSISDTTSAPRFILHVYAPVTKKSFCASCFASNNGMAVATGTGAGPWNYVWKDANGNILQSKNNLSSSDTLFNLQAGVYTVEVSGAACGTVSDTITITSPQRLDVTAALTDVSCNGLNDGTASAAAAGGTPPYAYLWNTGSTSASLTGLPEGNYSLTVTDANGCTALFSASVAAPVTADFIVNKDTLYLSQNDTAFFANNSDGALFYQWNFGDLSPADSSLNPSHYFAVSGNYTVTLVASDNSCYDTVSYIVVVLDSLLTTIPAAGTGNNFSAVYSNGEILLSFDLKEKEDVIVSVYNILGEKTYSNRFASVQKNVFRISSTGFSQGAYLILAETGSAVISRKILLPLR
ncbi:MAG: PKD domain-containing protein, partial [Bacteroidota bacterium]